MPFQCHINATKNREVRPICAHVSHFGPVPGVVLFLYRGRIFRFYRALEAQKTYRVYYVLGDLAVQQRISKGLDSVRSNPHDRVRLNVVSLANSSTAAALHSPPPTAHVVTAPVRGVATYKALGR